MRNDKQTSSGESPVVSSTAAPKRPRRWLRRLRMAALFVLIFALGVGFGSGRIHLTSQNQANSNLPTKLDYSSVDEVYQSLRANYNGKLTEEQLLNGLKSGLANATNDPYTEFFTAQEAKTFNDQLNNSFSGIGAELGKNANGDLIIVTPIPGFPADKAGLMPRDIIATIDGKSTSGLGLGEAVYKIRGKAGSTVKLDVIRGNRQLSFAIVRQNITVPSVSYKVMDGNIGYIQVITFGDDTSALVKQAAENLKAKGVKGVVLDLRGNPGGLLNAAVDMASQWLPEGTTLLKEKRGDVVTQTYTAQGDSPLKGVPTVVLINAGSASAAEITAGALKDNGAATIIGEKSFGKGVVQQLIPLSNGAQLKVTVASWYRPNGQNINHKGITPDQKVERTEKDIETGKDPQLDAALVYLKQQ